MNLNKNIVLLGMMGSGKSSIGHLLSKSLNLKFVDIDKKIEEHTNLNIYDIFEKKGESFFRDEEEKITLTAIAPPEDPPRNTSALIGKHPLRGLEVSNINPALTFELNLKQENGVVITGGIQNTGTSFSIVQPGDIIAAVNGNEIKSVKQLQKIMTELESKDQTTWKFAINRNGQIRNVIIK